jgi:hypothetical protein
VTEDVAAEFVADLAAGETAGSEGDDE